MANSLRLLGVTPADTVAICSENRFEVAATIFGTLLTGATLVMMNPTYTARELQHTVQLAKPTIVFVSAASVAAVGKVAKQCACIRSVISFDGAARNAKHLIAYAEFHRESNEDALQFQCTQQDMQNKVALILFSSGTTGLPKGVELTDMNILMSFSQTA